MTAVSLDPKPALLFAGGVQTASEAIAGFGPGGRVVGLTKGQFGLVDLVRAVLQVTGPAHLSISTWTMGIKRVSDAAFLIDRGELLSLKLLVDRSFATRLPQYCERVVEVFGEGAIRATNTHAKVALLRNDDWDVAIRSSMNLNRNARFEQFDLDDDPAICELFAGWIDELETLMPAGLSPPPGTVPDAFAAALDEMTRDQYSRARARAERRAQRSRRAEKRRR